MGQFMSMYQSMKGKGKGSDGGTSPKKEKEKKTPFSDMLAAMEKYQNFRNQSGGQRMASLLGSRRR